MDRKNIESKNELIDEPSIQVEENVNSNHRPFLSRLYSKTTPIGHEYHQVVVPPWTGESISLAQRRQQLNKRDISMRPQPTFLASRVNPDELENFLTFVQSYYQQKIADYFALGTVSKERTRARAMDFLHKMNYNYVKAKFYILFPYYLAYNTYRCHDPLNISQEDMEKKIKDHLDGLKNTKQKDMEKWVETLETFLNNKTGYQKFMSLVDQGKQNKYQMPENIKQNIQKSQKMGKQLKKSVQGNKLSIEILRSKRQLLDDFKLITPDMISFQDTVSRCEDWIKKQESFQQKYINKQNGKYSLKNIHEKIQYRQMQLLVNEYSNLPLLNNEFEMTTKLLFQKTNDLLQNIPNISKIVKTRNSKEVTINKIPYKQMKDYLKIIQNHMVCHEEFVNFQVKMRESMELIQRMSMYLQDPLSQKNSKTLNNYIKLMSDVQIQNNVEKRLKNRQQCNDIIDRIKKQISNPGKVESIKQSFNKLKQKGIEVQDLIYQEKIKMYIGWYQSQQKLKQPKFLDTNLQIIEKQLSLKQRLVNAADFSFQLESAKKQWNIGEQLIKQAQDRLLKYHQNLVLIERMLKNGSPQLNKMIDLLKNCVSNGLMFPQLWQLHDQIVKYFVDIAKIHYLLKIRPQNLQQGVQQKFFFKPGQTDHIISLMVFPQEMKMLKTKQKAQELLNQIKMNPFPRYLEQCKAFQNFMNKGQVWAERVRQLIKNFTELGDSIDIKQLEDSRYYIHSKAIKQQIGKIQTIIRWRQKISKKLDDGRPELFSQQQETFLIQLQKDLNNFESLTQGTTSFKQLYLEYSKQHDTKIKRVLHLIVNESKIQNICKLSQMNKFHRQIEKQNQRHKLEDKKILQLKQKFRDQIINADEWKEKYLIIKRFQKKKMYKRDQHQAANDQLNGNQQHNKEASNQNFQGNNDLNNEQNQISHPNRKKFIIKNGQFAWYFKFLIMILQFSKGYKLKFCLEQLLKLRNSLIEIQKFIAHYDKIFQKSQPYDTQLVNLDTQASKIQIFIRQIWLLKKKIAYVHSWRIIADSILQSVPIVNMELKARKPQQLLTALENKRQETEEANKQSTQQKNIEHNPTKRERKPNSYYFTSDITLYAQQNLSSKPKKKKKGNNDGEYRNTAVASQVKKSARSEIQEIQRTTAMIIASVEAGALSEDLKQYCICRYGEANQNSTMVQCDAKCEQWYHIECIGIKKHQAKADNRFTCVGCRSLYGLESQGSFYWDYHSKISEYALQQIVTEGKNLGVTTQQLKKVIIVYQKMKNWKATVNQLMNNILRDDFLGKQISSYKDKLYEAYLLSLWLPTFHHETSTLKRLLILSRNEQSQDFEI